MTLGRLGDSRDARNRHIHRSEWLDHQRCWAWLAFKTRRAPATIAVDGEAEGEIYRSSVQKDGEPPLFRGPTFMSENRRDQWLTPFAHIASRISAPPLRR